MSSELRLMALCLFQMRWSSSRRYVRSLLSSDGPEDPLDITSTEPRLFPSGERLFYDFTT